MQESMKLFLVFSLGVAKAIAAMHLVIENNEFLLSP